MVTKNMLIAQIVEEYPAAAQVLMGFGMHCIGCMAAHGESLEDACAVHGLDPDEVMKALNESKKNG